MKITRGEFKGKSLASPKNNDTRPTTQMLRQSVFNICQQECEGARFLDLFAGSGAMGIEALSLGAKFCTFVDNDIHCIKCIKSNLSQLKLEHASSVIGNDVLTAIKLLAKQGKPFDLIYADPPYHEKGDSNIPFSAQVVSLIDILTKQTPLLAPGGILFIEDGIKLKPEELNLECLSLKNVRTIGRAFLHQFILS